MIAYFSKFTYLERLKRTNSETYLYLILIIFQVWVLKNIILSDIVTKSYNSSVQDANAEG